MKHILKVINGNVKFLLLINGVFVRNTMPASSAEAIIKKGHLKKSNIEDFPISIDDNLFFEGEIIVPKTKKEIKE